MAAAEAQRRKSMARFQFQGDTLKMLPGRTSRGTKSDLEEFYVRTPAAKNASKLVLCGGNADDFLQVPVGEWLDDAFLWEDLFDERNLAPVILKLPKLFADKKHVKIDCHGYIDAIPARSLAGMLHNAVALESLCLCGVKVTGAEEDVAELADILRTHAKLNEIQLTSVYSSVSGGLVPVLPAIKSVSKVCIRECLWAERSLHEMFGPNTQRVFVERSRGGASIATVFSSLGDSTLLEALHCDSVAPPGSGREVANMLRRNTSLKHLRLAFGDPDDAVHAVTSLIHNKSWSIVEFTFEFATTALGAERLRYHHFGSEPKENEVFPIIQRTNLSPLQDAFQRLFHATKRQVKATYKLVGDDPGFYEGGGFYTKAMQDILLSRMHAASFFFGREAEHRACVIENSNSPDYLYDQLKNHPATFVRWASPSGRASHKRNYPGA